MTRYDIIIGKIPDAKIPKTKSQTAHIWTGMVAAPNGDVYAKVPNGNIYKQSGGIGDFVDQATCVWNEIPAVRDLGGKTSLIPLLHLADKQYNGGCKI